MIFSNLQVFRISFGPYDCPYDYSNFETFGNNLTDLSIDD